MEPHQESEEQSNQEGQSASPLYEYYQLPPDAASTQRVPRGSTENEGAAEPSAQDIQQGLVYPPPPSYYQNLQVSPERPPLPGQPPLPSAQQFPNVPFVHYGVPGQPHAPSPGMPAPTYAPGQFPGMMPPALRVKRSRKHIWIIVSIISVSALLLCGAGAWAFYNVFSAVYQQVSGAPQVVTDFYQRIQNNDETNAYFDLHIDGLTSTTFMGEAQAMISQYGPLISFKLDTSSFSSTNGSLRWQITVDVTRQHSSYTVPLTVDNINGAWKITAINRSQF